MAVTIRTLTLGIGERHPFSMRTVARAAGLLREIRQAVEEAGYTVQTVRLSLHPLLEDMASFPEHAIRDYVSSLQEACASSQIDYCSLGPAPADDPAFSPDRIALLPELIHTNPALSASVQLGSKTHGVRFEAMLPAAQAILALSENANADANFRFAALACCDSGGPFFPQAYTQGRAWTLAVGLQSAGLVRDAITRRREERGEAVSFATVTSVVCDALTAAARPLVSLASQQARTRGLQFTGIDLSPAPMGSESIGDAFEAVGTGKFGESGTLAIASALTAAIKGTGLPTCGYTGLMLPVLEDETIGLRAAEGLVSLSSLLAWSAVCGTGLDTVPIPGDTPPERIAGLLLDMTALACRLGKPLSARLFPARGLSAGDMTTFASPYLTNSRVLAV